MKNKKKYQYYWDYIQENSKNRRERTKEKLYKKIVRLRNDWNNKYDINADELIKKSLDDPCPYCKQIISIDNISLDHKTPQSIGGKEVEIICWRCNRMKGELLEKEYKKLLKFINTFERLKARQYIKRKLSYLDGLWKKK